MLIDRVDTLHVGRYWSEVLCKLTGNLRVPGRRLSRLLVVADQSNLTQSS